MRIGAAVTLYNREYFIGAYLEQLLKHDIIPIVALSDTPWGHGKEWGGNEETLEHDKSEQILANYFPEVTVIKGTFLNHRESFMAACDELHRIKVDRIILNDCDMFLEDKNWSYFKDFISTHGCLWKINHATSIIEYFYDYNYGKPASPGGPPPLLAYALNCGLQPQNMTNMNRDIDFKMWDNVKIPFHHFRYCKANGSGKHKCQKPETDDFTPAPEEIRILLDKWQTICKS